MIDCLQTRFSLLQIKNSLEFILPISLLFIILLGIPIILYLGLHIIIPKLNFYFKLVNL